MKNSNRKLSLTRILRGTVAVLLIASMAISITACKASPTASSEGESSAESVQATVKPEVTATPEASPTPETTPESAVVVPSKKTNLLTGQDTLSKGAYGKRPIAVMVNNALASLPQYGISTADIIFEIPVEGDITRLMCVYGDYTKVPEICSIRSCRYYYPLIAVGMDAVYIHWGLDKTVAQDTLNRLDIDHIDGNYGTYGLFDRDQSRINEGYNLEHTSRLDGTKLVEAFKDNDVRTDLSKNYKNTVFQFSNQEVTPDGDKCSSCTVSFSNEYYSTFEYNKKTGTYFKGFSGSKHVDGKTGEQLEFTNLVVLETTIGILPGDTSGRREVDLNADHYKGYFISNGAVQNITWSKGGDYDPIKIYDKNGDEVIVNKGKTYVAICNAGSFSVD